MQKQISQNPRTRNTNWKKFAGAAVVGAFAFAPFYGPATPSEAQPPTWGYGDRDRYRDRDRDGNRDWDRNRDWERNREQNDRVTLRAEVIAESNGDDVFVMRYNGKNFNVVTRNGRPSGLRRGRDVEVNGYWHNGAFWADRVTVLDNNSDWNDDRNDRNERTLEGIVSNDRAGREFILQLDNGQRIQVRSDEREPRRLTDGDRVRVRGFFSRSGERNRSNTRYNDSRIFRAEDVQIIRNRSGNRDNRGRYGSGSYGGANGSYVNFFATVIEANERAGSLRVRGDNGREYTLRVEDKDDIDDLRRGERVRIRGYFRNGVILASDVDEI